MWISQLAVTNKKKYKNVKREYQSLSFFLRSKADDIAIQKSKSKKV